MRSNYADLTTACMNVLPVSPIGLIPNAANDTPPVVSSHLPLGAYIMNLYCWNIAISSG